MHVCVSGSTYNRSVAHSTLEITRHVITNTGTSSLLATRHLLYAVRRQISVVKKEDDNPKLEFFDNLFYKYSIDLVVNTTSGSYSRRLAHVGGDYPRLLFDVSDDSGYKQYFPDCGDSRIDETLS